MIETIISIIVVGVIVWLVMWAIDAVGLPEPFHKIAKVLIILVSVLWLLNLLLPLAGVKL